MITGSQSKSASIVRGFQDSISDLSGLNQATWPEVHAEAEKLCVDAFDGKDDGALTWFHRTLFNLYRVNFLGPDRPEVLHQYNADLIRLRGVMEDRWLKSLHRGTDSFVEGVPGSIEEFLPWLQRQMNDHPANSHPLYDWLRDEGTFEQFRIFFSGEAIVNSLFDEFIALTQLGAPPTIKMELAKNYWDEMGDGQPEKVHTTMFDKLLRHMRIQTPDLASIGKNIPAALAQGNLFLLSAVHRRYFYQMMGILGAGEQLVSARYEKVVSGARRVGISDDSLEFYIEHITVDKKHSDDWWHGAVLPTIRARPELVKDIARGAMMRMQHIVWFSDTILSMFTGSPPAGSYEHEQDEERKPQ